MDRYTYYSLVSYYQYQGNTYRYVCFYDSLEKVKETIRFIHCDISGLHMYCSDFGIHLYIIRNNRLIRKYNVNDWIQVDFKGICSVAYTRGKCNTDYYASGRNAQCILEELADNIQIHKIVDNIKTRHSEKFVLRCTCFEYEPCDEITVSIEYPSDLPDLVGNYGWRYGRQVPFALRWCRLHCGIHNRGMDGKLKMLKVGYNRW